MKLRFYFGKKEKRSEEERVFSSKIVSGWLAAVIPTAEASIYGQIRDYLDCSKMCEHHLLISK